MMLRFATRASALARQQTSSVIDLLQAVHPGLDCRELIISTRGDRELGRALPEIGGKGLFTEELEGEILAGRADAAVHSLKDLPVEEPAGLLIAAIPGRAVVNDVLVAPGGFTLETLPRGARLGTSSPRRAAQLLSIRPDLNIQNLRGNVNTRLRKVEESQVDAIVLAAAGLARLGLEEVITEVLPIDVMLPAPGQGALAVQCRNDNLEIRELLISIEDAATRKCVQAERAFLAGLGGGCALPVAAFALMEENEMIHIRGLVASHDGHQVIRVEGKDRDPERLGAEMARQAQFQGADRLLG